MVDFSATGPGDSGSTNIYVAGLPETTDESSFKQLFDPFGPIQSIKLCQGKYLEKYGFVRYNSPEEAQTAINSMNDLEYGGRRLQVRFANPTGSSSGSTAAPKPQHIVSSPDAPSLSAADVTPTDNLYIKGLPPNVTAEKLQEVFGAYGTVQQTRVLDTAGLAGDSVALVRMGSVDEAAWILTHLNGNIPQGFTSPVSVKYADPPEVKAAKQARQIPKGAAGGVVLPGGLQEAMGADAVFAAAAPAVVAAPAIAPPAESWGANVYVAGIPESTDDAMFRQLFEAFGRVVSVKLCQGRFPEKYGFVRFSTPEEGQTAINSMNNFEFGGKRLQVRVANERGGNNAANANAANGTRDGVDAGSIQSANMAALAMAGVPVAASPTDNIYITGLPQAVTEQMLQEVFGAYGTVAEVQVLAQGGPAGSVATLRMGSVEEAVWMVTNLSGNIPQGLTSPLTMVYYESPGGMAAAHPADGGAGAVILPGMKYGAVRPAAAQAVAAGRYLPYPAAGAGGGIMASAASPALMQAVSETVAQLRGFPTPSGVDQAHLYVKGLPPNADDLYLYNVFSPFGAIQNVHIMKDEKGFCKGVGFVRYGFPDDAQVALSTINGNRLPDSNILFVAVKSQREDHH